jgi:uncharacterized protein (UPF0332 family)
MANYKGIIKGDVEICDGDHITGNTSFENVKFPSGGFTLFIDGNYNIGFSSASFFNFRKMVFIKDENSRFYENAPSGKSIELGGDYFVYILQSKKSILECERNIDLEMFDVAITRSYYATYYMIKLALMTKGMRPNKHKEAIGYFNKEFIYPQIILNVSFKEIKKLFNDREDADYRWENNFNKEDAINNLKISKKITDEIEYYLIGNGFVNFRITKSNEMFYLKTIF